MKRSVIGSTFSIKGEVSGGEDLLIEGRIEGRCVPHRVFSVTVGGGKAGSRPTCSPRRFRSTDVWKGPFREKNGSVLSETGGVRGKLIAPRVILEEGCSFKGSIDMAARAESSR